MPDEVLKQPDDLVGTVLNDQYEVQAIIALGSTSRIYRALKKDPKTEVALKVMSAEAAVFPELVTRFENEARVLTFLSHPGICSCLDIGFVDLGSAHPRPYLVLELIKGKTLAQTIEDSGPLATQQAISVFHQVCNALHNSHQFGVVHRGLNPTEIMLVEGEDLTAKVIDFGLARSKPTNPEDDDVQEVDSRNPIIGSRLYMSPEQRQGKPADARSDVYALGCIMYEALLARPPFTGETDVELNYKHMNTEPAPLTENWSVPGSLAGIVQRAMAKEPEHRFQTMAEMAQALAGRSTKQVKMLDKIGKLFRQD